jgi:hypothetical protein
MSVTAPQSSVDGHVNALEETKNAAATTLGGHRIDSKPEAVTSGVTSRY